MTSAAWVNYDNYGRLDLFVARYLQWDFEDISCGRPEPGGFRSYSHPDVFKPESVLLFHNDGGGEFSESAHRAGIDKPGKGLGLTRSNEFYLGAFSDGNILVRRLSSPNIP